MADPINQLRKLKEKLLNKEMSVMVGAGFSKNVSNLFPSWWELLFDAVYYLYGKEIENSYLNNAVNRTKLKNEFIAEEINNYIDKIGYLEIVSEYIKKKGFRESITTYIEERTPRIVKESENIFLKSKKGNKVHMFKIEDDNLKLHRLLLRLQWNNIYTTNYDEMLELANDKLSEKLIKKEIFDIENEISVLLQEDTVLQSRILECLDDNKTQELKLQLKYLSERIKKKEKDLIKFHGWLSECISVVTHSSQLSLKRNKNIIKLHGTLRKKNGKFGFDNDPNKTYVIAKEDYDSYPVKHEAFTQLMRISLLQESYCLIGFSGVDPNFIEWIKWVRDILQKEKIKGRGDDYKIYLIDVGSDIPDPDKMLFFENYGIYRIPLMEPAVINFLQEKTNKKIIVNFQKKELLELLMYYLSDGKSYTMPKASINKIYQNKYQQIWSSMSFNMPEELDFNQVLEKVTYLKEISRYNRIPSNNDFSSQSKFVLMQYAGLLMTKTPDSLTLKGLLLLVNMAINDCCITINYVFGSQQLEFIYDNNEITPEIKSNFREHELRLALLCNDVKSINAITKKMDKYSDICTYNSILLATFNLDFSKAEMILLNWNPQSYWILRKIGLLALFNIKEAERGLEAYMDDIETEDVQEQLYFYQMLRFIKQSRTYAVNKDIHDKISELEELGFMNINHNLDGIINDTMPKPQKIEPYGAGRFTTSNSFIISSDPDRKIKGLEFIQLLIQSGFPLKIGTTYLQSSENWYIIFRKIYENYPYPALFFSLQYSDEKLLARIAQDFIISPYLINEVNDLLPKLLKAYLKNPKAHQFKHSILTVSAGLFVAVESCLWENSFYQIWKSVGFSDIAYDDRRNVHYNFVLSALPYIKNIKILRAVVSESISRYKNDNANAFLYKLHKNENCYTSKKFQTSTMSGKIETIITASKTERNAFYVLSNLTDILSDQQYSKIIKNMEDLDFKNAPKHYPWKTIVYFSKKDRLLLQRIKKGIIANYALWNGGFTKEGLSSGTHHINLEELRYRAAYPNGLKWTKAECGVLFRKLEISLSKIEKYVLKYKDRDPLFNFSPVLEEMQLFLNGQEGKLCTITNYIVIKRRVSELVLVRKGYGDISQGLSSNDVNMVINALSDLFHIIEDKANDLKLQEYISIVLNKILLQSEPGFEASLHYVSEWMRDDENRKYFEPFLKIIIAFLNKYYKETIGNCDLPFVQRKLISISNTLRKWGINEPVIQNWQELKNRERYFNLKNETPFS